MKKITTQVLTEEYKITVVFGNDEELATYISKNCIGWSYDDALKSSKNSRGSAFNLLPEKDPLIALNSTIPYETILATLPHEASHAYSYIIEYLGIKDDEELRGHIISAVVRQTIKGLLGKKKLYAK